MVAATLAGTRVAAPAVAKVKSAKKGKSFLVRVYDAIVESQMKRAERELALYRHLLPHDFDIRRGLKKDQAPLGGW